MTHRLPTATAARALLIVLIAVTPASADRINARYETTPGGIRVFESSADPYVVKLLQAHAEVVSAFIANGRSEMMKHHPLPARDR